MASSPRIDELRKKFEENPRRYFAPLANEYRKAGDIDQAISICREYLPQQPGHMSGHIVYGQALYEARQFEEARTVFETALSLDPENLIALRHLGDIALIIGDAQGAQTWYRRVLEADPRNEEIQAQLANLEQAAPPAPAQPPTPEQSEPTERAASSATTVVIPTVSHPTPAVATPAIPPPEKAIVTEDSPTAEIRVDSVPGSPVAGIEKSVEAAPPTEATSRETPVLGLEQTPGSTEPPKHDSFSLAGLETTSLATTSAAPPTPEPTPASEPPAATATPAPSVEIPLLDLGDSPSAATPAQRESKPEETAAVQQEPVAVREPVAAEQQAAAVEQETAAAEQETIPEKVSEPAESPATTAAPAPPESGPFVTETMAELYLQQGHREEALRVYRALLEQRPDDASLRGKVASLAPAPVSSGPTIREVLTIIAARRPGVRAQAPMENGAAPVAAPAPEAPATPSPTTASASPEPSAPALPMVQPSARADGLATLFERAVIAPDDERAATALSLAFSGANGQNAGGPGASESPPITGAPARHTPSDLSLDKVFGTEGQPAAPSNFSFDQFFSQRATAENPAVRGGGTQESRDDVAQFTQWLEGLKGR